MMSPRQSNEPAELAELTVLSDDTGACTAARMAAREAIDQAEAHLRAAVSNPARTASLRALGALVLGRSR